MPFQFDISRDELFSAIASQQNITSKKGSLAVLSNVLMEVNQDHIILTGTDLEIGLKQKIPAVVFEPGVITLPAKKLFELVRESSAANLSFKEDTNSWVTITADSSLYKLAGMPGDEFPAFPEYIEENMVRIDSSIFSELIDKTFFSISQDKENMYSLTALLLQKESEEEKNYFKCISSDGHRLTVMGKEVSEETFALELNPTTLIPRKGVQEIRKFCDDNDNFLFGIEKKQAVLKSDDALLIIRLLEGEFPNYKSLLDMIGRDNILKINRLRFLESLKRINLFTEDMFHAIKMEIEENKVVLLSQNADFGSAKDELEIDYQGEPLKLGFNCRYFIDTLQVMEGSDISLCISSDESPCLITSDEDPGFFSIIMPMKL